MMMRFACGVLISLLGLILVVLPTAASASAANAPSGTGASPPTVALLGDTTLTDQDPAALTAVVTNSSQQSITVSMWATAGRNQVELTISGSPSSYSQPSPAHLQIAPTTVVVVPVTVTAGKPVRTGTTGVVFVVLVTAPQDLATVVTTTKDVSVSLSTSQLVPGILGISSALLVPGLLAIFCWLLVRFWDSRQRGYSVASVSASMWDNKVYLLLGLVISLVLAYALSATRIALPVAGVVDLLHSATLSALVAAALIASLLALIASAAVAGIRCLRYPVVDSHSRPKAVVKAMAKRSSSTKAAAYVVDGRRAVLLRHERGFLVLVPQIVFDGPDVVVQAVDQHKLSTFAQHLQETTSLEFSTDPSWIDAPKIIPDSGQNQVGESPVLLYQLPTLDR